MNRPPHPSLRILELAMAVGLFLIAAIVVLQVLLSAIFNSSITGANEIITKLFVYLTAIGSAVAVGRNEHIAISLGWDRLSGRLQRVARLLATLLVAVINVVIVIYSVHWITVTGGYLMPTTQLPRALAQLAVPIGSSLAVWFCLMQFIAGLRADESDELDESLGAESP